MENKIKKISYLIMLSCFLANSAQAEDINLVADERVEWHQTEQKMVAIGNAIATKKDLNIRADKMTAFYTGDKAEKAKNKSSIKTVHAIGGVIMTSPRAKGYGDTMDYDVAADSMLLRGKPAKIQTDKETITATESITYYPNAQKAIALGDVISKDAENTIHSKKMVAYFEKNSEGKLDMQRVDIFDDIKIVTPSATAYSQKGIYYPKTGIVKLAEKVKIIQDGNTLNGEFAETNLNTGISKIISGKKSGGRVFGIFKEKNKNEKTTQDKAEQNNDEKE